MLPCCVFKFRVPVRTAPARRHACRNLYIRRLEKNLRKCDKLKDHSDALADINKIRKISKYGHFRPKKPFFTPKKGQKSPKSEFAQICPPVASKSTKNGSFWRILRGLDLADNRGTSQCKRQKWSFFVIFDDFCDFSLLSDPF